jgi:four helix bundle protein
MSGAAAREREAVVVTSGSIGRHDDLRVDKEGMNSPSAAIRGRCHRARDQGSSSAEVDRRSGDPFSELLARRARRDSPPPASGQWPTPYHPSFSAVVHESLLAASSVPANLAEGHGRTGRDRLHFCRFAYASAKEVDSHLRLLVQAGAIDHTKTFKALSTFDEVRAMTWRLVNRKN